MATEAQIAANRRNANRSTGPRSAAGKARVARNAFRHGLAARLVAGTPSAARVRQLADALLGAGPHSEESRALAWIAAEAQQAIEQATDARSLIFKRTAPTVQPIRTAGARKNLEQIKRTIAGLEAPAAELVGQRTLRSWADFVAFKEAEESAWQPHTEAERQAVILAEVAPRLLRLDRYQKRALSRRRRALRDLQDLQHRDSATEPGTRAAVPVGFITTHVRVSSCHATPPAERRPLSAPQRVSLRVDHPVGALSLPPSPDRECPHVGVLVRG